MLKDKSGVFAMKEYTSFIMRFKKTINFKIKISFRLVQSPSRTIVLSVTLIVSSSTQYPWEA
jgi:hypothetical protein